MIEVSQRESPRQTAVSLKIQAPFHPYVASGAFYFCSFLRADITMNVKSSL